MTTQELRKKAIEEVAQFSKWPLFAVRNQVEMGTSLIVAMVELSEKKIRAEELLREMVELCDRFEVQKDWCERANAAMNGGTQ